MKKSTVIKAVGLLTVAVIAGTALTGCGKSTSKTNKGSDKDVTVWVNTSDETPEGKAWEKISEKFNTDNGKG